MSYQSASVLCFLVVVFVLLFSLSIVFSGGRFLAIIQLQYCVFWWPFLSYNSAPVLCCLVVVFEL